MIEQEPASVVQAGTILAGKYRVDRVLGMGGMGVVVAAHHIHLDERVAIKFLLPNMLDNGEAVARFAREARAAVKIKSEHVARVSDVGTLENGAPYMVMEYLDGGDLEGWLKQRGTLPVEQAVEFVMQACEALAEAHSLGITHRDLKPANLFVTRRPDGTLGVKVLDFGISKMRGIGSSSSPDASMTRTTAIMGSPLYMSPEQLQSSKDADAQSDIWSLGIIIYELLAGESPFHSDTMPELIAKILSTSPPPVRMKAPHVPEGLEAVIFRCLERDRGKRFESVGELAGALLPFAPKRSRISFDRISGILRSAGLSASALQLPPSSDPAQQARSIDGTQSSWGRTSSGGSSAKVPIAIVAGMLLLIVGVVFAVKSAWPPAPAPSASQNVQQETPPPSEAAHAAPVLPKPPDVAPLPGEASVAAALPSPSASAAMSPRGKASKATKAPVSRPVVAIPARPEPPRPAPAGNDAFDDRK